MRLLKALRVATPITLIVLIILFFQYNSVKATENFTETTYYFLTDHLGSTDVVLDDQGNIVERADYLPFGSDRLRIEEQSAPETDYKYTGKELDSETGLFYYGARYYDSAIGRFISFDPLLLNEGAKPIASVLMNPQELNPYSYVANNPIIMVDETGEYKEDVHYDLTFFLSMISGLDYNQSKTIAYNDQYTDDNPKTSPLNPLSTSEYHFSSRQEAQIKIDDAISNSSLEKLGTAMHTYQDTYSHGGLSWLDHLMLGDKPDMTHLDSKKALEMSKDSFYILRKMNQQINGIGDIKQEDYDTESDNLWGSVTSHIFNYLTLEDKTDTDIAKIADISKNKEINKESISSN